MNQYIIEACVDSVESAINAQLGGADRVELCDNILEGGTTPSYASILLARKQLKIDLFVIIRPRGGDFLYSDIELEIMHNDILKSKSMGADGIVFGILEEDGHIDIDNCRKLVELARPMKVTFHRAFDMSADALKSMEDIISLGIDRILTSGQAASVPDGISTIKNLVKQAAGRIIIMPGGGIREENIDDIRKETGASEFHVSLRTKLESGMKFKKNGVFMGSEMLPEFSRKITNPDRIKNLREILNT